ncbi:MAG: RHS repeat-associated core domain-containing protein [Propionicimonas sp.]
MSDLAGGLAFDVDDNGAIVLQIANLHGDIVATAPLGQAGVTYYAETDEYGVPQTTGIAGPRYGWLGTHQRDGATLGGLVLVGAHLYASSTGRFFSVDPVSGGGENRYTYPVDPVNRLDLDGEVDWGLVLEVGLTVDMLIPGAGDAVGAARLVMWGGCVR